MNSSGEAAMQRVPVRYADMSRQVAHIINNNSENVMKSAPFMTCHIANVSIDRSRTGPAQYVDVRQMNERAFDEGTQSYSSEIGNKYTAERLYPVPYTLTMQLDMWTSNTDQKLQLLEQIMMIFNPSLEVQSSSNILDWTRLSVVELTDITWSSRSMPQGSDSAIDVATLSFKADIWISPPAKVTQQKIIHRIINDIHEFGDIDERCFDASDIFGTRLSRQIITPKSAAIEVNDGKVYLLSDDLVKVWGPFLDSLGTFNDGFTQLRLKAIDANIEDDSFDVVGTLSADSDPDVLIFNIDTDTLPTSNITIKGIIDPNHTSLSINEMSVGDNYLVTDKVIHSDFWKNVDANANDIVQWDGSNWSVVFESSTQNSNGFYATNLFTGDQLRWYNREWISNYFGTYAPGYWTIAF